MPQPHMQNNTQTNKNARPTQRKRKCQDGWKRRIGEGGKKEAKEARERERARTEDGADGATPADPPLRTDWRYYTINEEGKKWRDWGSLECKRPCGLPLCVCLVLYMYWLLAIQALDTHAPCSITTVIQAPNYRFVNIPMLSLTNVDIKFFLWLAFTSIFLKYFYSGYQPGGWTTQPIRLTAPQRYPREDTYGILFIITGKGTELAPWTNQTPGPSVKADNWHRRIFWHPSWAFSCKEGPELVLLPSCGLNIELFGVCAFLVMTGLITGETGYNWLTQQRGLLHCHCNSQFQFLLRSPLRN